MNWELVSLATIAVATLVMSVTQIVVLLRTAKLAEQAARSADDVRREVQALAAKAHRIADDLARASSLAVTQVERVDRLLATTAERVDSLTGAIHSAVVEPLRDGSVFGSVLRAVLAMFARGKERRAANREEEDALFVG